MGKALQTLREFDADRRVRLVPTMKGVTGGHRFSFTKVARGTRIDHELELSPHGFMRIMGPMMTRMGRKNLRDTSNALAARLEGAK